MDETTAREEDQKDKGEFVMRQDGRYIVYRIQHEQADGKWVYSNFDHFGTPLPSFGASGDCWQVTGIHGSFEHEDVSPALTIIRDDNPENTFRAVRVNLMQQTMVIPENPILRSV